MQGMPDAHQRVLSVAIWRTVFGLIKGSNSGWASGIT
jgi:hypothetical protein